MKYLRKQNHVFKEQWRILPSFRNTCKGAFISSDYQFIGTTQQYEEESALFFFFYKRINVITKTPTVCFAVLANQAQIRRTTV